MMSRLFVSLVVTIMLLFVDTNWAGDCPIKNGSFEEPGHGIANIRELEPNDWDVNMPLEKFGGQVGDTYGVTDGNYSLTLWTNSGEDLEKDDIAYVYQKVVFRDVNEIAFSINLDTNKDIWGPNSRSAVVIIDDEVMWELNSSGPDASGLYWGEVYPNIGDFGEHKFAVGLRVDARVDADENEIKYYTDWDSIGCTLFCGGNGFLLGDFSRDCYVDFIDYAMFASVWRQQVDPNSKFNLSTEDDVDSYGIINFRDYAVLADIRDSNDLSDLEMFTDVWLSYVDVDDYWNLFGGDDVDSYGIIDLSDIAVFVNDWLRSSYDE